MENIQENTVQDDMLNREDILNKAREVLESYNSLFNEGFDERMDSFKKEIRKLYKQNMKKFKKRLKKSKTNKDLDDTHIYEDMEDDFAFEEFFHEKFLKKIDEIKEEVYDIWKKTRLSQMGDKSVEEFFKSIDDLDLLIEILCMGAVIIHEDVPRILAEKLYTFGEEGINKVIEKMLDVSHITAYYSKIKNIFESNTDDKHQESDLKDESKADVDDESHADEYDYKGHFLVPLEAIKILGGWRTEKSANTIIEFLKKFQDLREYYESVESNEELKGDKDNYEIEDSGDSEDIEDDIEYNSFAFDDYIDPTLFGDTARDALISIGEPAIRPLLNVLTKATEYEEYHEYLAMALAKIGKIYKSDEIYKCLRKMFREYDDKIVMADCLGEYGDGRAVPVLRGYVERNIDNVDSDTLFTIDSAIRKLGGSIDDLLDDYIRDYMLEKYESNYY